MWQWFLRALAALLVAATCLLPAPARAQTQILSPNPPSSGASDDTAAEKGHGPPVAAYAAAVLFTVVVLVLICVPSRKG